MIKKIIKRVIRKILHHFDYEISRRETSHINTFVLQSDLIKVREPVILDIGAHTGGVTKLYRKQFPFARIYCFEPFPESFQLLSRSVEEDPRTFCYQTAVSEKKGTAILNENLFSATNSLLETDERGASFWGERKLSIL